MIKEFVYSGYECYIRVTLDYKKDSLINNVRFHLLEVICPKTSYYKSIEIEDKYLISKIESEEMLLKKSIEFLNSEDKTEKALKNLGFV